MNPHAAALLYILAADGPTTADDLAYALRLGRRAITEHLTVLEVCGLVAWQHAPQDGVGVPPRLFTATAPGQLFAAREQVAA